MRQLLVGVLGALQVQRDGVECDVAGRRQRALLAALAVMGRPVSVGELVDAVWEDDPPDHARTTLQTYVSRLRGLLGPDVIRHGAAGYWLDRAAETDVGVARRLREELRGAEDPARRATLAVEALDLWRGPALVEFADQDWFRSAAVELSEMRARLVEVAADALIASGRAPEAVSLTEMQVAALPLREPTQVLLVRALHAAGRTTDALRAADRYRRELRDETGLLPGAALVEVEAQALASEADLPSAGRLVTWSSAPLPRPTPLIGRATELVEIESLVRSSRLVTLVGVGGVGKTRLLAELVHHDAGEDPWLVVDLAPVEPCDVAAAVGTALGYRAEQATTAAVAELVRSERVTIALDNCEHVLGEARDLARALLRSAPEVRIVATSRARLDLPEERLVHVGPLATDGSEPPAVRLFIDRLERARPRDEIDADDPALVELCARLDGVPLALELAASRAAALGVPALAARLDASLDLLVDVRSDHDRHATIGNVIAWSVDLLDSSTQLLLGALSSFQGAFDLAAAEAVGGAIVDEPVPLLLGRLVDTSLVSSAGTGRYRLLQIVRHFAQRRLEELGRVGEVRRAHARWVGQQCAAIDAASAGPDEASTVARLDALRHDAGAALKWSTQSGQGETAAEIAVALAGPMLYRPDPALLPGIRDVAGMPALRGAQLEAAALGAGARAAFLLGELDEVEPLAQRALAADPDPTSRHRAEHALGVIRLYQGRFADSAEWFQPGAEAGSPIARLDALGGLALAQAYAGRVEAAERTVTQHESLAGTIDSDTYRAFADYVRGEIHLARGDGDAATDHLVRASERAWNVGATFVWGIASTVAASVLVRCRPPEEARRHLPLLIERWRRTATWPQLWTTLRLVAEFLAANADPELALLVLEAAAGDPAAPALSGPDHDRERHLRDTLTAELGPAAAAGVTAGAAAVDRVTVLERATAALLHRSA